MGVRKGLLLFAPVLLLLMLLTMFPQIIGQQTALTGLHSESTPSGTHIELSLSGPVDYRVLSGDHPDQLVIELQQTRDRASLHAVNFRTERIRTIRGEKKGKQLRVIIEMLAAVESYQAKLLDQPNGERRLVVSITSSSIDSDTLPAPESPALPAPATEPEPPLEAARKTRSTASPSIPVLPREPVQHSGLPSATVPETDSIKKIPDSGSVRLTGAELRTMDTASELILWLTGRPKYHLFTLDAPHRVVVDLQDARGFAAVTSLALRNKLVNRIRGARRDGGVRLVLDLSAAVAADSYWLAASDGQGIGLAIRMQPGPVGALVESATPAPLASVSPRSVSMPTGVTASALQQTTPEPGYRLTVDQTHPQPVAVQTKVQSTDLLTEAETPAIGAQEAILPLLVDGQARGEIYLIIDPDVAESRIDAPAIIAALEPDVVTGVIAGLRALPGAQQLLSFHDLSAAGISIDIDSEALVAHANISPELRRTRELNLHSRFQGLPEDARDAIMPQAISAGLDVFAAQGWLDSERQPLDAELDGYFALHGWVLQNRFGYEEGRASNWTRLETQLIKDWPDRPWRLRAGDLVYPSAGLMGNTPLSGITLGTQFDLQPYNITFPLSRHEFFLEQDARVDIFVNGILRTTRDLAAGNHDLFDLPLISGVNDVRLEITDAFGRRRTLRFFDTQEVRMLSAGLEEFSVTAGLPRSVSREDGIDYQTGTPAFSAFYRRGIRDDLTLGSHVELTDEIAMTGISGIHSTRLGTFDANLALSHDRQAPDNTAAASRFGYSYRNQNWGVNMGLTWQDRYFARLGQRAIDDNIRHAVGASVSLPRIAAWSGTVSVSNVDRWGGDTQRSARLTATHNLGRSWRIGVDLIHQYSDGERDNAIGLQGYWSPPGKRVQANLGYLSHDNAASQQLELRRQGELGLDARAFNRHSDKQRLSQLDASYVDPLFETRGTVSRTAPETGNSVDTRRLSLGTALVLAGRELALSRPLNGQPYALLQAESSLREGRVGVVRGAGSQPFAYLEGSGDKAVLPNLSPYYVNDIKLTIDELPLDIQLEKETYKVFPGYRSGTLVEVGVKAEVYLTGQLHDPAGAAVAYQVGVLQSATQTAAEVYEFFTDGNGHFEIADVSPDIYRIRINRLPEFAATLTVPEDQVGQFDIGRIQLGEAETER